MVFIHTPTNNLEESRSFYDRLQFRSIPSDQYTLYTDGKAIVEINPDRYARAGLRMFRDDWSGVVSEMESLTKVHQTESASLIIDPNGVYIYLEQGPVPELPDIASASPALTGNFMGLSLETSDMEGSALFWQKLGYEITHGGPDQSWMSLSDGGAVGVSFMKPLTCPHLFFNPSLTYFNGQNNLDVIAGIRAANIPITEEITHFNKEGIVDNIIIRDPGGYGFFIFSD